MILIFVLYPVWQKMSSFVQTSEFGKWLNFEPLPDSRNGNIFENGTLSYCYMQYILEIFIGSLYICLQHEDIAVSIIKMYYLTETWYIIENLSLVCQKSAKVFYFKSVIWPQNWRWYEIRIHVLKKDMETRTKHDIVPFSKTHAMFQN